jgi:hypothetical protein
MRTFIFLIGNEDEFDSLDHLKNAYFSDNHAIFKPSVYRIQLRADCGTDTMTVHDIATYIGRGLAFESWTMDGTYSALLEA